jgi:STE24 endopeptidase
VLDDEALEARLEDLLTRCGFKSKGIFVMDGSKRSAHGNAYFTGFGRNKRIVFFDTLLKGMKPEEIEAVLAHELGHFKHKHIQKRMIMLGLMSLAGLALLGWLSEQNWFYSGLGVTRETPALALILFTMVVPVFMLFFQPAFSAFSRTHEFEADNYAAKQSDVNWLISGLVSMYRDNASTLTPDALYSGFHHSHPPAPVRIAHLSTKI